MDEQDEDQWSSNGPSSLFAMPVLNEDPSKDSTCASNNIWLECNSSLQRSDATASNLIKHQLPSLSPSVLHLSSSYKSLDILEAPWESNEAVSNDPLSDTPVLENPSDVSELDHSICKGDGPWTSGTSQLDSRSLQDGCSKNLETVLDKEPKLVDEILFGTQSTMKNGNTGKTEPVSDKTLPVRTPYHFSMQAEASQKCLTSYSDKNDKQNAEPLRIQVDSDSCDTVSAPACLSTESKEDVSMHRNQSNAINQASSERLLQYSQLLSNITPVTDQTGNNFSYTSTTSLDEDSKGVQTNGTAKGSFLDYVPQSSDNSLTDNVACLDSKTDFTKITDNKKQRDVYPVLSVTNDNCPDKFESDRHQDCLLSDIQELPRSPSEMIDQDQEKLPKACADKFVKSTLPGLDPSSINEISPEEIDRCFTQDSSSSSTAVANQCLKGLGMSCSHAESGGILIPPYKHAAKSPLTQLGTIHNTRGTPDDCSGFNFVKQDATLVQKSTSDLSTESLVSSVQHSLQDFGSISSVESMLLMSDIECDAENSDKQDKNRSDNRWVSEKVDPYSTTYDLTEQGGSKPGGYECESETNKDPVLCTNHGDRVSSVDRHPESDILEVVKESSPIHQDPFLEDLDKIDSPKESVKEFSKERVNNIEHGSLQDKICELPVSDVDIQLESVGDAGVSDLGKACGDKDATEKLDDKEDSAQASIKTFQEDRAMVMGNEKFQSQTGGVNRDNEDVSDGLSHQKNGNECLRDSGLKSQNLSDHCTLMNKCGMDIVESSESRLQEQCIKSDQYCYDNQDTASSGDLQKDDELVGIADSGGQSLMNNPIDMDIVGRSEKCKSHGDHYHANQDTTSTGGLQKNEELVVISDSDENSPLNNHGEPCHDNQDVSSVGDLQKSNKPTVLSVSDKSELNPHLLNQRVETVLTALDLEDKKNLEKAEKGEEGKMDDDEGDVLIIEDDPEVISLGSSDEEEETPKESTKSQKHKKGSNLKASHISTVDKNSSKMSMEWVCHICGQRNKSLNSLKLHVRRVHDLIMIHQKEDMKCKLCTFTGNWQKIKDHIIKDHNTPLKWYVKNHETREITKLPLSASKCAVAPVTCAGGDQSSCSSEKAEAVSGAQIRQHYLIKKIVNLDAQMGTPSVSLSPTKQRVISVASPSVSSMLVKSLSSGPAVVVSSGSSVASQGAYSSQMRMLSSISQGTPTCVTLTTPNESTEQTLLTMHQPVSSRSVQAPVTIRVQTNSPSVSRQVIPREQCAVRLVQPVQTTATIGSSCSSLPKSPSVIQQKIIQQATSPSRISVPQTVKQTKTVQSSQLSSNQSQVITLNKNPSVTMTPRRQVQPQQTPQPSNTLQLTGVSLLTQKLQTFQVPTAVPTSTVPELEYHNYCRVQLSSSEHENSTDVGASVGAEAVAARQQDKQISHANGTCVKQVTAPVTLQTPPLVRMVSGTTRLLVSEASVQKNQVAASQSFGAVSSTMIEPSKKISMVTSSASTIKTSALVAKTVSQSTSAACSLFSAGQTVMPQSSTLSKSNLPKITLPKITVQRAVSDGSSLATYIIKVPKVLDESSVSASSNKQDSGCRSFLVKVPINQTNSPKNFMVQLPLDKEAKVKHAVCIVQPPMKGSHVQGSYTLLERGGVTSLKIAPLDSLNKSSSQAEFDESNLFSVLPVSEQEIRGDPSKKTECLAHLQEPASNVKLLVSQFRESQVFQAADLIKVDDRVQYECARCKEAFPQLFLLQLHHIDCTAQPPSLQVLPIVHIPTALLAAFFNISTSGYSSTCVICKVLLLGSARNVEDQQDFSSHLSKHCQPRVAITCLDDTRKVGIPQTRLTSQQAKEWVDYIVPPFKMWNKPTSAWEGNLQQYICTGSLLHRESVKRRKSKRSHSPVMKSRKKHKHKHKHHEVTASDNVTEQYITDQYQSTLRMAKGCEGEWIEPCQQDTGKLIKRKKLHPGTLKESIMRSPTQPKLLLHGIQASKNGKQKMSPSKSSQRFMTAKVPGRRSLRGLGLDFGQGLVMLPMDAKKKKKLNEAGKVGKTNVSIKAQCSSEVCNNKDGNKQVNEELGSEVNIIESSKTERASLKTEAEKNSNVPADDIVIISSSDDEEEENTSSEKVGDSINVLDSKILRNEVDVDMEAVKDADASDNPNDDDLLSGNEDSDGEENVEESQTWQGDIPLTMMALHYQRLNKEMAKSEQEVQNSEDQPQNSECLTCDKTDEDLSNLSEATSTSNSSKSMIDEQLLLESNTGQSSKDLQRETPCEENNDSTLLKNIDALPSFETRIRIKDVSPEEYLKLKEIEDRDLHTPNLDVLTKQDVHCRSSVVNSEMTSVDRAVSPLMEKSDNEDKILSEEGIPSHAFQDTCDVNESSDQGEGIPITVEDSLAEDPCFEDISQIRNVESTHLDDVVLKDLRDHGDLMNEDRSSHKTFSDQRSTTDAKRNDSCGNDNSMEGFLDEGTSKKAEVHNESLDFISDEECVSCTQKSGSLEVLQKCTENVDKILKDSCNEGTLVTDNQTQEGIIPDNECSPECTKQKAEMDDSIKKQEAGNYPESDLPETILQKSSISNIDETDVVSQKNSPQDNNLDNFPLQEDSDSASVQDRQYLEQKLLDDSSTELDKSVQKKEVCSKAPTAESSHTDQQAECDTLEEERNALNYQKDSLSEDDVERSRGESVTSKDVEAAEEGFSGDDREADRLDEEMEQAIISISDSNSDLYQDSDKQEADWNGADRWKDLLAYGRDHEEEDDIICIIDDSDEETEGDAADTQGSQPTNLKRKLLDDYEGDSEGERCDFKHLRRDLEDFRGSSPSDFLDLTLIDDSDENQESTSTETMWATDRSASAIAHKEVNQV